nr:hypothetical protein [Tanacetum cinerariifolium]
RGGFAALYAAFPPAAAKRVGQNLGAHAPPLPPRPLRRPRGPHQRVDAARGHRGPGVLVSAFAAPAGAGCAARPGPIGAEGAGRAGPP